MYIGNEFHHRASFNCSIRNEYILSHKTTVLYQLRICFTTLFLQASDKCTLHALTKLHTYNLFKFRMLYKFCTTFIKKYEKSNCISMNPPFPDWFKKKTYLPQFYFTFSILNRVVWLTVVLQCSYQIWI
jgi:hypothetical protein